MRQRLISGLLVGLLGLVSLSATALGLGEIELHTRLNEPLRGEIKLHNAQKFANGEIVITFAGEEVFRQQGLEKPHFLNDFRFEVVFPPGQAPRVLITSHQPIREPYLSFILEARWPSGKVQREYMVLLDKPTPLD